VHHIAQRQRQRSNGIAVHHEPAHLRICAPRPPTACRPTPSGRSCSGRCAPRWAFMVYLCSWWWTWSSGPSPSFRHWACRCMRPPPSPCRSSCCWSWCSKAGRNWSRPWPCHTGRR